MSKKLNLYIALFCLLVFTTPLVVQNVHILTKHNASRELCIHENTGKEKQTYFTTSLKSHCPICEYEFVTSEKPKSFIFTVKINPPSQVLYVNYQLNLLYTALPSRSSRAPPYC